jgi:putative nucleotidyltransferase with HDIG domain
LILRIDRAFLRSKVARRIFILFITCAILPITALAVISYDRVTDELERQSQTRLFQGAKSAGMVILERLQFVSTEMKTLSSSFDPSTSAPYQLSTKIGLETLAARCFKSLAVITPKGKHVPLFGNMGEVPSLKADDEQHLASGKLLLTTLHKPGQPPRILLRIALKTEPEGQSQLVGEIKDNYLWDNVADTALPPNSELCVLDPSGRMLFSTLPILRSLPQKEISEMVRLYMGKFEWKYEKTEYMAIYWSLFTKYEFHSPKWIMVMSEPKAYVLAPADDFKKSFTLILLLTVWVVLFLSFKQIRRSLVPLEKLREGTHRIAGRDFQTRVTVKSGDEFEELADSFNIMAGRLGRQFNTLITMNEIDRSILSALDTEKIVTAVLTRLQELFPCDCAGLALFAQGGELHGEMYVKAQKPNDGIRLESIRLTPQEVQELHANPETLFIDMKRETPLYLAPLSELGMKLFLAFPVFVNKRVTGVMALGFRDPSALTEEDQLHARQLADQVAVALSNARLIEDLEELNWGTLYALARAIDAKSPWTAGHSERVTDLALKIGRVMGLSNDELRDLQRAGLLHDIGKLGIPGEILDKPGKLTESEYDLMRQHPQVGAKILEPITAYTKVKPLVLYHHEHFDGSGYPEGLSGEKIPLGARIFSLADKYDALTSDRPYRPAKKRDEVIEYLIARAGFELDPKVVEAFLKVLAQEKG